MACAYLRLDDLSMFLHAMGVCLFQTDRVLFPIELSLWLRPVKRLLFFATQLDVVLLPDLLRGHVEIR
jgi:hypothetical protein